MSKNIKVGTITASPTVFANIKKSTLELNQVPVLAIVLCNAAHSEAIIEFCIPPISMLKEKYKAKINDNGKMELLCIHRERSDAMEILPVVMSGDSIKVVLEKRNVSMEDVGAMIVTPSCEQPLMQLALLHEMKMLTNETLANGIVNLMNGNIVFIEMVNCRHGNS